MPAMMSIPDGVTPEFMKLLIDRAVADMVAADIVAVQEPPRIYVIGALKNPRVRAVAAALRETGAAVFDDWHGAGPDADTHWREYEQARGHTFAEALARPLAKKNFGFDMDWLEWCNTGVLVLPAGKSGHLEMGWLAGQNKKVYALLEGEPENRWDLMYMFMTRVFTNLDSLVEEIGGQK